MEPIITLEKIAQRIFLIRGEKVMLDFDLAELYGIATGTLNQAVSRNIKRFPPDFLFQLNPEEMEILRSQFVISKNTKENQEFANLRSQFATSNDPRGGRRYLPYAFTERGVAMLSSVLHSERAIQVNIEIMRAFVQFRGILSSNKDLARKLDQLEKRYDHQFKIVFDAIRELMAPPVAQKKQPIGFDLKKGEK